MMRNAVVAALFFGALGAPPAYRVRFAIQGSNAAKPDVARITAALRRGLYRDSLIVPGADSMFNVRAMQSDTAWRLPHGRIALVAGNVVDRGDSLDIQLRLVNVIAHPLAPPETLHVQRAQLDSVLADRGRAYARVLAAIHL
jgi:hypothetical protein